MKFCLLIHDKQHNIRVELVIMFLKNFFKGISTYDKSTKDALEY